MFRILLRKISEFRKNAPINAKRLIQDRDTSICLWVIKVITLIMDRRSLDHYYSIACIFFHKANHVLNNGSLNASVG